MQTAAAHQAREEHVIEKGQPAPAFELPDQDGKRVDVTTLRGRYVVLYFYPKANTPGCTVQACSARDNIAAYGSAGATVLGVSPDAVSAIRDCSAMHNLPFRLLSDEDHSVCKAYGVWVEKNRDGQSHQGPQRATFIIDPAGYVAHVIPEVVPATHDDEVLAALGEISDGVAA
jgi:peroxiredoxin Q/BCP